MALKLNFADLDIPDMNKKIELMVELPFTMEIFRIDPATYQEQEGTVTFSKKNWAIKFSPSSKEEFINIVKDNAKGILDTLKQAAADKVKKEANDAGDKGPAPWLCEEDCEELYKKSVAILSEVCYYRFVPTAGPPFRRMDDCAASNKLHQRNGVPREVFRGRWKARIV